MTHNTSTNHENGNDANRLFFLDYEIRSSWWASWIGWNWGQELAGKYFAWKVKRKYARYNQSKAWEQRIKNLSGLSSMHKNGITET